LHETDIAATPIKYFPSPISSENYLSLLGFNENSTIWGSFSHALMNSLLTCLIATLIVVVIAVLSGYAFARLEFRGRDTFFILVLVTMALPAYAVIIPLYKIMIDLGLVDTLTGITLIYVSAYVPLSIWLMRNYFKTIPRELDEAAMIDGASRLRALWTILPLSLPGMVTAAILAFLNAWGQFLIPLVFAPAKTKPLTVLITEFNGRYTMDYGMITAAGIITMIPPILIVLLLNRYLMSGLMTAAVKK
jgi:multiple sugar transport system permease protein